MRFMMMRRKEAAQKAGIILGSALLTVLTVWLDSTRTLTHLRADATRLGRQVASQVETFRLYNPRVSLEELTRRFSVSPEDPVFRVLTITQTTSRLPGSENSEFNPKARRFSLERTVNNATSEAVRIDIGLPFPGFLGTRTRFASDAWVLAVFATFAFFGFGIRRLRIRGRRIKKVQRLLGSIQGLMMSAAQAVRNVVTEATNFIESTKSIQDDLKKSHDDLHARLGDIHQAARFANELRQRSSEVASVAKKSRQELSDSDWKFISLYVQLSERTLDRVIAVEKEMEPLAASLDDTVRKYESSLAITQNVRKEVRSAMSLMMEEAKVIEKARAQPKSFASRNR